ncbi:MAG: DNA repair protein RecO [Planctomycetota bacterium]
MAIHKTRAVVLNTYPYSDGSLIVHLATRRFGRLSVIAKGARRPKSKMHTQLDRLYVVDVVVYFKPGRSVQTLSDVSVEEFFPELRRSLPRFYAAHYACELVETGLPEEQPNAPLFDRLVLGLRECDQLPVDRLALWALHFDASVLGYLGLSPSLERCGACGRENPFRGSATISLSAGSVICRGCRASGHEPTQAFPLSAAALRTWRLLAVPAGSPAAKTLLTETEVPRRVIGELRGFMNRFLPFHLERQLRLQKHLPAPGAR